MGLGQTEIALVVLESERYEHWEIHPFLHLNALQTPLLASGQWSVPLASIAKCRHETMLNIMSKDGDLLFLFFHQQEVYNGYEKELV